MEVVGRFTRRTLMIVVIVTCGFMSTSCSSVKEKPSAVRPSTITIWTAVEITHDPLAALTSEQHFFTALENRTLFTLTSNGSIQGELAKQFHVSSDGLSTRVTLNKDTFSDGKTITSSDVKATLSRLMVAGGDYASLLSNVKGSGEAKSSLDFFGIKILDKQTLSFELITPDPFFVFRLAHPSTAILPAKSIGEQGALMFKAHSGLYTAGKENVSTKTTTYKPRIKELPVVHVVQNTEADISKKPQADKVDIILSRVSNSTSYKPIHVPQLAIASWNLYVKGADSPLTNVQFRQAILSVIDTKESIGAYTTRANIPTGFTGRTFDSVDCGSSCVTNKAKALSIIKELYPTGAVPGIAIDIEDNEIQHTLAKSAVAKLAAVGIPATVKAHDATELSNVIARGEVELFRFGWISEVAVGSDPLVKSFKADSTENVSGISDATLEKNIATYESAVSFAGKLKASQILQERIKDLWLTRPVAHFHKTITVNKRLSDVTFDYYGRVSIEDIRISNS
ncbi:MAG TPA: ABC transporter substrate-binding protein [Acidimicrobiia bacterium]|nr:ABC transporter substrate-binding protein [Acidimicrobiia bacterium]